MNEVTVWKDPALQDLLKPKWSKFIPHSPTPKQQAFLWLGGKDAFYGGAVGGGKSDALLMCGLQYVDVKGYAGLLIRDTYTNLTKPEGLLSRAHEWLAPWIKKGEVRWVEKTATFHFLEFGSTLSFGYLDGPKDHFNYMSAAYQFIGVDEVVSIRKNQALFLFSRLRRLQDKKEIPIRFRCASNPPLFEQLERGEWVKERYVNPKTRKEGVVFISAKLADNPHLDGDEYRETLRMGLDPITLRQLEDGDWDIQVSDRFFLTQNIKYVDIIPDELIHIYIRSWDMAATEERKKSQVGDDTGPAYTCGVKGCMHDNMFIVTDIERERVLPGPADKLLLNTAQRDGQKTSTTCEQEPGSSGKRDMFHVSTMLRGYTFSFKTSTGSKVVRARPLSAWMNLGRVAFLRASWNAAAINELRTFPDGKFKDIVDAMSSCFSELSLTDTHGHSSAETYESEAAKQNKEMSELMG